MKNIRVFLSEKFRFFEVKFSIYLNRRVFVVYNITIVFFEDKRKSITGLIANPNIFRSFFLFMLYLFCSELNVESKNFQFYISFVYDTLKQEQKKKVYRRNCFAIRCVCIWLCSSI